MTSTNHRFEYDGFAENDAAIKKVLETSLKLDNKEVEAALINTLKMLHSLKPDEMGSYLIQNIRLCTYILRGWTEEDIVKDIATEMVTDKASITITVEVIKDDIQ